MPPMRRHQITCVSDAGWKRVLSQPWPDEVQRCLRHWQANKLPLVVTRQRTPRPTPCAPVALGLSVPPGWTSQPISLQVRPSDLLCFSEFPQLADALAVLPPGGRTSLEGLASALRGLGTQAHAYGSVGWQYLTGLGYLHGRSDLDLWVPVESEEHADRVARLLRNSHCAQRIDGELMFPGGAAVAWREWQTWRERQQGQILVKRLHGVTLETWTNDQEQAWLCAA